MLPAPIVLASRGVGEAGLVAATPEVVVVLAALVTQVGDGWATLGLAGLLYWYPVRGLGRREAAALFGLAGLAATAIITLKVGFALPRPPGATEATAPTWLPGVLAEAFVDVATDEDLGFPSGHATATATVYGGLALLLDRGSRRERALVAGTLIAVVSLTRVVLGLHYAVDVVAGAALGLGLVAGGLWLPARIRSSTATGGELADGLRGVPTALFAASAVAGVVGVVVAGGRGYPGEVHDAVVGVGSGLGGAVGWLAVERARGAGRAVEDALPVPATVAAAVPAGGAWAYVYGAEGLPLVVAGVVAAVAITVVVGLPALVSLVEIPG